LTFPFYQPGSHEFHRIRGDGKTDPLGGMDHGGVHPDDFTPRVNQGASRIPGVQGGIGLDDVQVGIRIIPDPLGFKTMAVGRL
jgi:hypothetical protein